MLILTLDYCIEKVEHYIFKHNKHKGKKRKNKTKKNLIIIFFINDKEEKNFKKSHNVERKGR